jgi:hypothetical protein
VPKQGSITIVNKAMDDGTPKYLDLTHLGPKSKAAVNIKLPQVNTNGAFFLCVCVCVSSGCVCGCRLGVCLTGACACAPRVVHGTGVFSQRWVCLFA